MMSGTESINLMEDITMVMSSNEWWKSANHSFSCNARASEESINFSSVMARWPQAPKI